MSTSKILNGIMKECRISNVYLKELTNIHDSTISLYRRNMRNIGQKSFPKIYAALDNIGVGDKFLNELKIEYENWRLSKKNKKNKKNKKDNI